MKTPLKLKEKSAFKKDLKRVLSQGKTYGKYRAVILTLLDEEELDPALKDHPLTGNWKDHRELHIEPDWLLIYKIAGGYLILARTGSHAELF